MKILVVDDSRAVQALLSRMLKELGHETLTASDGREALSILEKRQDIELALVDWNMPVMTGLELVKAVRASPLLRGLPILMVTSEAEAERVLQAVESGASEYLMKPFSKEELASKIELILQSREAG